MYVSGSQVVTSSTSSGGGTSNSGSGGSGGGGGGGGGGGSGGGSSGGGGAGTYVIQGGYMLGSASQSYSHTTRASPATVSANSGPSRGRRWEERGWVEVMGEGVRGHSPPSATITVAPESREAHIAG